MSVDANGLRSKYRYSQASVERLSKFVRLLEKWNPVVNLISRSSAPEIWERHVVDSARLLEAPRIEGGRWVDIGSGGGFPGLVVAILAQERFPSLEFTLVESDQRKSAFLGQAAQLVELKLSVVVDRIENVPPLECDILSARALAPLGDLFGYASRHLKPSGRALFLKGTSLMAELEDASKAWSFVSAVIPGETETQGPILDASCIERK